MQGINGLIFNVQKFCVHDGPGIRTTVFLQGCPLRCLWCSNPESQHPLPQLGYKSKECRRCHRCIPSCPYHALNVNDEGYVVVARDICNNHKCMVNPSAPCTSVCPSGALFNFGKTINSSELIDEVENDFSFYARSGGGITLSGGEALYQPAFTLAVLADAKLRGIHTAIETTAFSSQKLIHQVCEQLSYLIMDIKLLDGEGHQKWTGVNNRQILDNYDYIRRTFPDLSVKVRTPLIPGVNDNEKEIQDIVDFLKPRKPTEFEILSYHALGENKYSYLGRDYVLKDAHLLEENEEKLKKLALRQLD